MIAEQQIACDNGKLIDHPESKPMIEAKFSWKGIIESINKDEFVAKLYNRRENSFSELVYDFSKLKKHQLKRIEVGAKFFLIAYANKKTGEGYYSFKFKKRIPYSIEEIRDELHRLEISDLIVNT